MRTHDYKSYDICQGKQGSLWGAALGSLIMASRRLTFSLSAMLSIPLICSPGHAQAVESTFDGVEFIRISGGEFLLGSPADQGGRRVNERMRRVPMTHDFWISKFEVTQGQWESVMGANPSNFRALGPDLSYPVESISWHDAQQFINALNQQAGGEYYRMPTEVEWEFVAKASSSLSWSFGELEALLGDYTHRDGSYAAKRVGVKLPNAWGVYDLYGNVSEWCEDWYQVWPQRHLGACPNAEGEYKVIKGGANSEPTRYLRSSSRNFAHPDRRSYAIGLRLVRVMDPQLDSFRSDANCQSPAFCGDGMVNNNEACDDGNLEDNDGCSTACALQNVPNNAPCTLGQRVSAQQCVDCPAGTTRPAGDVPLGPDTSCLPIGCGDGVINGGEVCDDGSLNSDLFSDACRSDCSAPRCGDAVLDLGEDCDDGNLSDEGFCDSACQAVSWSVPTLLLLIDFSDTSFTDQLANPDTAWSDLMFGDEQGQGNHYWAEMLEQRFSMTPAQESSGTVNDGVIRVKLTAPSPSGNERYVVEDSGWIQEALNLAAAQINFNAYDQDNDGELSQRELSILTVLNTSFSHISGAGAQANILIDHILPNNGLAIPYFARTLATYGSIGVNLHELGHHFFALKHIAHPNHHELMGLGAYNEDPNLGTLTNPAYSWGTRPAHLTSFSRMRVGSTTPATPRIGSLPTTLTLNAVSAGAYNSIQLPTEDGYLILANRHGAGYDSAIPFCPGHQGGLVVMEIAQYIAPVDLSNMDAQRQNLDYVKEFEFCDHYAVAGHNDSFSMGGYLFTEVSAAGPTMTMKAQKVATPRAVESYKWRWFKLDPDRPGYQLWWHERASTDAPTEIDFSEIPFGDNASGYFTMLLNAYYDTNEIRSVNSEATWSSSTPYISFSINPVTGGPGTTIGTSIVRIIFEPGESCPADRTAVITAEVDGANYEAKLINIPCH